MYCTNCSKELLNGANFCTACGATVATGADLQQVQTPMPMPSSGYYSAQDGFNLIIKTFKDNLFLACLICFTLAAISTVLSEIMFSGMPFSVENFMGIVVGSVFLSIPGVLALLGGWILYYSAGAGRVSGTPFNLMMVAVFVIWVYSVVVIIFSFWGIGGLSSFGGFGLLLGILLVPLLILLIIATLVVIIYSIIGFNTLHSLRHTAKTGEIKIKSISLFAVLTIIGGILIGLSSFSVIPTVLFNTLIDTSSPMLLMSIFLSQALNCVGMILLGRVLLRYKDNIRRINVV